MCTPADGPLKTEGNGLPHKSLLKYGIRSDETGLLCRRIPRELAQWNGARSISSRVLRVSVHFTLPFQRIGRCPFGTY